ncbi:hypothetical protein [Paenisporosarcina sp. OV554]|uniref:hypothetical protein n=1 Tax=Paenisporosarcina sp. OV554 TaxID=2135694 RepID=UPI000D3C03AF|nr:hypothetical protein [Paenisporosarcina sp. OV554]PUB09839.1 hypothetical protein C8K15_12428 [Paenisporosarcina sp. OV554]
MKKVLNIIILSFIFFSAGSIFGTGGFDTKSTVRNIDSLQSQTIELGYTSAIDVWKTFKQVEIFIIESQENMEATINQFRDEQVKLAVAGLVNYKNATKSKPDVSSSGTKSVLEVEEPIIPVTNDLPPKQEPMLKTSGSHESTTNTSNDSLEDSPELNRDTDVLDKMLE